MAIAIVAFALVAMLSLLPLGMNRFRQAMDYTVGAQIAQRVITDAEQTDFDRLIASAETAGERFYVLPIRYFDEQGTEIFPEDESLSAEEANLVIYQVRVRGSQPGPQDVGAGSSGFTSLPAADEEKRFRPRDATFLTVQVANIPGGGELAVDKDDLWRPGQAKMEYYTTIITRNGYPKNTPL
jgi:uncharacterized protein (TIGR02598 family)